MPLSIKQQTTSKSSGFTSDFDNILLAGWEAGVTTTIGGKGVAFPPKLRKYTSHQLDQTTNLTYANQRYYNQKIARFISEDIICKTTPKESLIQPQSLNCYSYALNNPYKYTDPTGDYIESAWDIVSISAGIDAFNNDWKNGSWTDVVWSGSAIVIDVGALFAPIVPAGAGALRKVNQLNKLNKVIENTQVVTKVQHTLESLTAISRRYGWGRVDTLARHAQDHASDFGIHPNDVQAYASSARDWVNKAHDNIYIEKFSSVEKNKTYFYDQKSNTFAVQNRDGTIATYYKPDPGNRSGITKNMNNIEYWNWLKQTGGGK